MNGIKQNGNVLEGHCEFDYISFFLLHFFQHKRHIMSIYILLRIKWKEYGDICCCQGGWPNDFPG